MLPNGLKASWIAYFSSMGFSRPWCYGGTVSVVESPCLAELHRWPHAGMAFISLYTWLSWGRQISGRVGHMRAGPVRPLRHGKAQRQIETFLLLCVVSQGAMLAKVEQLWHGVCRCDASFWVRALPAQNRALNSLLKETPRARPPSQSLWPGSAFKTIRSEKGFPAILPPPPQR